MVVPESLNTAVESIFAYGCDRFRNSHVGKACAISESIFSYGCNSIFIAINSYHFRNINTAFVFIFSGYNRGFFCLLIEIVADTIYYSNTGANGYVRELAPFCVRLIGFNIFFKNI